MDFNSIFRLSLSNNKMCLMTCKYDECAKNKKLGQGKYFHLTLHNTVNNLASFIISFHTVVHSLT